MFRKPNSPVPLSLEKVKSQGSESDDDADEGNNPLDKETLSVDTCRICLGDGYTPIFGEKSISEDIMKIGHIQVIENDGLPQHICNLCLELLKSAIRFSTIAMESDSILRYDQLKKEEYFSNSVSSNNEDSEEFSDTTSMDQNSDTSRVYLEYESSGDEFDTSKTDAASNIEDEEEEIDPKDMYMVIVSDNKTGDSGFHCELCNIIFKTADEINKHLLTHDLKTCKKCEICNNILEKNVFQIHMKLHKEAFKQRTAKSKAQCKQCGKVVYKTYLKYHMKMHGTVKDKMERMKQCPICDKAVSYHYFNDHMKRMHDKIHDNTDISKTKMKKCPICDRTYKEMHFNKHMASHGQKRKRYICDQCGREFKQYSAFRTHSLTHSADLKFKCQFCPYRGLHLGLLKIHVRTHTKDYLYQCSTCNKKFITKSNLSMHERRHKAPDSFICLECNKGFYSQRNLNKHYNMIHLGIRDEKCEFCGKMFGHRDGLLGHQRQVHKTKPNTYKGRLPSYLKAERNIQNTENEAHNANLVKSTTY